MFLPFVGIVFTFGNNIGIN